MVNREPKYYRIKQDLLAELANGTLAVGDDFYTEPQLQARYNCSRGTVRRALDELEKEGYLIRQSGKKSSVARVPRSQGIEALTAQLQHAGLKPSTAVLSCQLIQAQEADEFVAAGLQVPATERLIRIRRLRIGNNDPMAIQTVFLRLNDFPDLPDLDLTQSLITLYQARYNRRPQTAEERLQVVEADRADAAVLGLSDKALVVTRQRVTYDQDNRPFEVLHAVDRADCFVYRYRIGEDATVPITQ